MPDELEQKINWCIEVSKAKGIDLPAQLSTTMRAYFLSQALDLIGADEEFWPADKPAWNKHNQPVHLRNELRAELRAAFQAKYGGENG